MNAMAMTFENSAVKVEFEGVKSEDATNWLSPASHEGIPLVGANNFVVGASTPEQLAHCDAWARRVRDSYEPSWSQKARVAISGARYMMGPTPFASAALVLTALSTSYAILFFI